MCAAPFGMHLWVVGALTRLEVVVENLALNLPAPKNRCLLPSVLFSWAPWSVAAVFPGQLWVVGVVGEEAEEAGEITGNLAGISADLFGLVQGLY